MSPRAGPPPAGRAGRKGGDVATFVRCRMRSPAAHGFADSIRASSRVGLHPKAGHMTASDLYAAREIISCQAGAIHT